MAIIKLFDAVKVIKNMPELQLKAGMIGAVIEIFTKPNLAYEVEFSDDHGVTVAQAALLPEQVKKIENITKEEYRKRVMPGK